jgi:hypothetical protein
MTWPDDEPQEMRLAEGHAMTDTAMVPGKSEGRRPARPVLIDEQLADQLLGKAQAEGVELLGPDGLLSQVTKAVLERALGEEMTATSGLVEGHDAECVLRQLHAFRPGDVELLHSRVLSVGQVHAVPGVRVRGGHRGCARGWGAGPDRAVRDQRGHDRQR